MSTSITDPTADTRAEPRSGGRAGLSLEEGSHVGRYVVLGHLGKGGMGEVLAAYDPQLDRRIALKLIGGGRSSSKETARARLVREAQALAKLAHPNVVAIFDAGTHDDLVFIAMEHIDGVTLDKWLAEQPRPWPAVVRTMIAAGRGLAAAHAEDLVHRDFKPANIMFGRDGRVRVLDFGIARLTDEASSRGDSLDGPAQQDLLVSSSELTAVGTVVGTPAYMAPEQFIRGIVDQRTDQFAFCVVLYRALFGTRPFSGTSFKELAKSVWNETPTIPRNKGIPPQIRRALERGLAKNADDRHTSMNALLTELERGLGQRKRWLLAGGGLGAALAVGGVLAGSWGSAEAPCQGMAAQLDGIWDEPTRAAVETAMTQTGTPYAADAASRVQAHLDDYTEQWVATRTDACEATRVRGEQSESLMDLRVACLDRRHEQLRVAVELLADADAQVVQHAVDVAQNLPSVAACSNAQRLLAAVPPPDGASAAAEVDALRAKLARVEVLSIAGKYEESSGILEAVVPRAEALGYMPLEAEVRLAQGGLDVYHGRPEQGLERLDHALFLAVESGHTRIEAKALISSLSVLGNNRAADPLALRNIRHAEAVVGRLGHPPELEAQAQANAGIVFMRRRELPEAVRRLERALELAGDSPQAQRLRTSVQVNLAAAQGLGGDVDAAVERMRQAIDFVTERLGSSHPLLAQVYNNLGTALLSQGNHAEAIEHFEHAERLNREVHGPDHPDIGTNLLNLSLCYHRMDRLDEAITHSERGLAIKRAALGPDDPALARSLNNHGDFLKDAGRLDEALAALLEADRIMVGSAERVYTLASLADVQTLLGKTAEAEVSARGSLAMLESTTLPDTDEGELRFVAAQALWAARKDRAEAKQQAARARAAYARSDGNHDVPIAEIDRWIAEHR